MLNTLVYLNAVVSNEPDIEEEDEEEETAPCSRRRDRKVSVGAM
jgi:hypothetical protein